MQCIDTCYHKFALEGEYIEQPDSNEERIDWSDAGSLYDLFLQLAYGYSTFSADGADELSKNTRLNNYLPTFQPYYETSESKFVHHLKCPESKYTFYMDADIIGLEEQLADATFLVLLDRTVFVSND